MNDPLEHLEPDERAALEELSEKYRESLTVPQQNFLANTSQFNRQFRRRLKKNLRMPFTPSVAFTEAYMAKMEKAGAIQRLDNVPQLPKAKTIAADLWGKELSELHAHQDSKGAVISDVAEAADAGS